MISHPFQIGSSSFRLCLYWHHNLPCVPSQTPFSRPRICLYFLHSPQLIDLLLSKFWHCSLLNVLPIWSLHVQVWSAVPWATTALFSVVSLFLILSILWSHTGIAAGVSFLKPCFSLACHASMTLYLLHAVPQILMYTQDKLGSHYNREGLGGLGQGLSFCTSSTLSNEANAVASNHTFSSKVLQLVTQPPFKISQSLFIGSLITTAASYPTFTFFAFPAPATLNGLWLSRHTSHLPLYASMHSVPSALHGHLWKSIGWLLLSQTLSWQVCFPTRLQDPWEKRLERRGWFTSKVLT